MTAKIVLCLLPRGTFPTKCDKVNDVNACKEILKNSSCSYLCLKTVHLSKYFTKNIFAEFVA